MMLGLGIFIMLDSLFLGIDKMTIDNMTSLSSPAIKLVSREYAEKSGLLPLDYGIPDSKGIMQKSESVDGIIAASLRTTFRANASNYENELPLVCVAIDPEKDVRVFELKSHLEGSWLHEKGDVLIGSALAHELELDISDYLLLSAKTRYGSWNADEFRIAGILDTTDPNINRQSLFMSFPDAEEFAELDGLVTEIVIKTERPAALKKYVALTEKLAKEIGMAFPELEARSFFESAKMVLLISEQKYYFSVVLVFIVLLIAMVGIVNSILMSVYERIREIGVLRSFGLNNREIEALFMIEGITTGLVGSILGLAFGSICVFFLVEQGYPIAEMFGDLDFGSYPVWGTVYGEWNIIAMTFALLAGLFSGFLASWIPARKAGKIQVIEALRFV